MRILVLNSYHFSTKDDAWHFGNSMEDFGYTTRGPGAAYPIPYSSFVEIFGRNSAKVMYKRITSRSVWGGNCNGMAAGVDLFFTGGNLTSVVFGKDAVSLLDLEDQHDNLTIKTIIEAMQLSQHTKKYSDQIGRNLVSNSQIQSGKYLNSLYETVCGGLKRNLCTVLAVQDSSKNIGHALLAYEIEEAGTAVHVHVYDCNYPGTDRVLLLERDSRGNYCGWSYEIGGSYGTWGTNSEDECAISYIPYETVESVWTQRGNLSIADLMLTVNSSNLVIRDVAGDEVARLENGILYTAQEDVYSVPNFSLNTDNELRGVYLPMDYYYIENLDEDMTFNASLTGDNLSASVTTTTDIVSFSMDESTGLNVVLIPNAYAGDTFSVEMDNGNENVTLEGMGTGGNISISNSTSNGLNYSNCDMLSVQIDGVEQLHTISASAGFGGSVSPEGDSRVKEGKSLTYYITPDPGYVIYQVLIDGNPIGNPSSYTFPSISASHTITATFIQVEIVSASIYVPDNLIMFTYSSNMDVSIWAVLYDSSGKMIESAEKTCRAVSGLVTDVIRFESPITTNSKIKLFAFEKDTMTPVRTPKTL